MYEDILPSLRKEEKVLHPRLLHPNLTAGTAVSHVGGSMQNVYLINAVLCPTPTL
jgi:hypothetical protein